MEFLVGEVVIHAEVMRVREDRPLAEPGVFPVPYGTGGDVCRVSARRSYPDLLAAQICATHYESFGGHFVTVIRNVDCTITFPVLEKRTETLGMGIPYRR